MARNDVFLNINALSPADAVVTGQQDMTAATVPELVLGDTPTFNFYFTDNTNVWPSWAGNAAYTVTWALSDAVSGDFSPAATTGNATPITGGWSVILPLNAYDLVGLLNTKRVSQPYPVTNLWQQIRVADPSGNEVTRAMFWTPIRYRAISDTQNTESASPTGGREVTVDNVNALTTPTAAQFYAANPVPTSALGSAANGELLIGNGTGFTKATLTAGSGVSITNGSGSITISATDGDITLDDGTAAAPSLKFTADTDTGIYRPSDNVLGISAGGVSRATFGATSAINGTTIPSSKTLVVTTDKISALAATTSAELAGVISDETGSGALVFATSPTLTTPILGTPQSGTLSSCTGLPISTGVSGLGTNVATFLATPSSANLASAVTDETGTGALVFANTPTLVTPNIGAATGTSVNLSGAGTFGGNLTVSGTGTSSVAGPLKLTYGTNLTGTDIGLFATSGGGLYINAPTTKNIRLGFNLGDRLTLDENTATFATNLTVSGTGTSSVAGNLGVGMTSPGSRLDVIASTPTLGSATAKGTLNVGTVDAGVADSGGSITFSGSQNVAGGNIRVLGAIAGLKTTTDLSSGYLAFYASASGSVTEYMRLFANGNLFVGASPVDSSNGKLQLATHTTSAGGIGFGTDTSLFRTGTGTLRQTSTNTATAFRLANSATASTGLGLELVSATAYLYNYENGSLILGTNNTTALTLDSSQNATFAGTVIANKATTAFRIPTAETPASASATGTIGTITWDASYIYVCTAANTWKRVAIATWP